MMLPSPNKDCALSPARVSGHYRALHRPSGAGIGGNYMWIARSPDLLHWGWHQCIARTRPGRWDGARVVAAGPPVETPRVVARLPRCHTREPLCARRHAFRKGETRAGARTVGGSRHGTDGGLRALGIPFPRGFHQRARDLRGHDHRVLRRRGQGHLRSDTFSIAELLDSVDERQGDHVQDALDGIEERTTGQVLRTLEDDHVAALRFPGPGSRRPRERAPDRRQAC